MQTRSLPCDWPGVGSPGSRATSFHTCQVLRPRRVLQALALTRPSVSPSAFATASTPESFRGWLAYVLLCRRFAAAFAGDRARLVVDVDRYSFSYRACTDYSLPVSRRTAKDSGTSSRQRTSRNRRASA